MFYDKNNLPRRASITRYLVLGIIILVVIYLSRSVKDKEPLFVEHRIMCNSTDKIKTLASSFLSSKTTDVLSIFAIDETLVRRGGTQDGGSEWFSQSIHYLQKTKILSFEEARNVIFPLYKKYLKITPIELIEKGWVQVFALLKKKSIPLIALTRRSVELSQFTLESLEQLGLVFSHNYLGATHTVELSKEIAQHFKGAIFSGLNNKSDALEYFIIKRHSERPFFPRMIVLYVDNTDLQLEAVSRVLHTFAIKNNIKMTFYSVHYQNVRHNVFELSKRHKIELDEAYEVYSKVEELLHKR